MAPSNAQTARRAIRQLTDARNRRHIMSRMTADEAAAIDLAIAALSRYNRINADRARARGDY